MEGWTLIERGPICSNRKHYRYELFQRDGDRIFNYAAIAYAQDGTPTYSRFSEFPFDDERLLEFKKKTLDAVALLRAMNDGDNEC